MKVTISFNGTKIVVPCGEGDITVRELTALAATRYKKAIGKHMVDYWVSVSSLKSEEGGMLDPDDLICDVADDREQMQAIFDEQKGVGHLGDGMSSDSDNNSLATDKLQVREQHQDAPFGHPQHHQQMLPPHMPSPHGSASQLYRPHPQHPQQLYGQTYSTASSSSTLVHMETEQMQQQQAHMMLPPASIPSEQESNFDSLPDSQSFETKCSLHVLRRREPLGASANKPDKKGSEASVAEFNAAKQQQMVRPSVEVVIPNEIGPLGIHVVPCDEDGRLVVQGIEPGGRIDRDGRLAVGDEIIEINGYSLTTVPFNTAQEIFKDALSAKELGLQVIKGVSDMVAENKENVEVAPQAPSTPPAGSKVTSAFQANNTRKIGDVFRIFLKKGPSGLGFSITTRDNAPGGITPIYIKTIMPKGAAIEEGRLKPGDRLLEVNGASLDGMGQSEVVAMLRNVETNSVLDLVVSRHSVGGSSSQTDGGVTPGGSLRSSTKIKPSPDVPEPVAVQEAPTGAVYRPNPAIDDPEPRSLSPATSNTDNYESYDSEGGSAGSSFQFPWKQREILTFDIPVHDTERAGLGVSVKGKTSSNSDGSVADLGIFVKSVLHGGAASRDGRLSNNDQLVNINGLSLLGKPNPQAMETLRKAMHEEGPMPGIISLTVARKRKGDLLPGSEKDERRNSMSSIVTSSSDDIVREYNVSQPMFKSPPRPEAPPLPAPNAAQQQALNQLRTTRNPVIDRLMGKDSAGIVPSNIRNDSYYIATHQDTMNQSMMQQQIAAQQMHQYHQQQQQHQQEPLDCPTVYQTGPESLMIEQEERPQTTDSADTRESLTSLVDLSGNVPGFTRDMPGRQSMSEKRHATLDAKSTDTYQKRKKARDDRMRREHDQKHMWKKSASVESLHTAGAHEILSEEEREALKNSYVRANSVRVSRSRGCNESFRQAVDRSYERDLPEGEDYEIEELDDDGQLRKMSADKSEKKKNRNSKLLRNFGAMFRLGSGGAGTGGSKAQNRKSMPGPPSGIVSDRSQSTSSMLPVSQSVPDYKSYSKSRSGGDLAGSATVSDFARPYAPQLKHPRHPSQPPLQGGGGGGAAAAGGGGDTYDYLPSAMMRPGSRVGIADPNANTAHSDYEVIQRHLHRNRTLQPPAPQLAPAQYRNHPQHHTRSQSNPSRVQQRPKSNFYEYDLWSEQRFAQPQQQQQPSRQPQHEQYYNMGAQQQQPNPHAIRRYSPQPTPSFHQQQQQHGLPTQAQPQQQQQAHHFHYGEVAPVGTHFSLPRGSK